MAAYAQPSITPDCNGDQSADRDRATAVGNNDVPTVEDCKDITTCIEYIIRNKVIILKLLFYNSRLTLLHMISYRAYN